jgi:hypothetical protein
MLLVFLAATLWIDSMTVKIAHQLYDLLVLELMTVDG